MTRGHFWVRVRRGLLLGAAWTVLGYLVVPMVIVLPVSLTDRNYLSLPEHGLSLRHYAAFFTDPVWIASALQSLAIAAVSTVAALVIGTLCAIGCWRLSNGFASWMRLLMLAPLIVPTVVQGLAMYRLWVVAGIFDSYLGVILAHTMMGIPYVVITTSASLASFNLRLEQAARSLGASALTTIRLVIVPSILPGLVSGAVFAFVNSFDELVIVLFITSREIQTLPKRIWDGMQDRIDPTVAAVAMILIAATFMLLLGDLVLRRRRVRLRRRAEAKGDVPPAGELAAASN